MMSESFEADAPDSEVRALPERKAQLFLQKMYIISVHDFRKEFQAT